jgi:hypothetical protein
VLSASGSILGAAPVVVPIELPVADPRDDAPAEVARLAGFGKDIAQRLAMQRAQDWLNAKLSQ